MLTTVLFDMGGTLEDIWHNEGTKREALQCVWDTLRAHGLEPEVDFGQFQELILASGNTKPGAIWNSEKKSRRKSGRNII